MLAALWSLCCPGSLGGGAQDEDVHRWFSKEVLLEQACKAWQWAEGREGKSQAGVSEERGRIANNFRSPDGRVSPPCKGTCGVKYCVLVILPFHTPALLVFSQLYMSTWPGHGCPDSW